MACVEMGRRSRRSPTILVLALLLLHLVASVAVAPPSATPTPVADANTDVRRLLYSKPVVMAAPPDAPSGVHDAPPQVFVMVSSGCAMSTAVQWVLRHMVGAHTGAVASTHVLVEATRPFSHEWVQALPTRGLHRNDPLLQAALADQGAAMLAMPPIARMELLLSHSRFNNQSMVLKAFWPNITDPDFMQWLQRVDGRLLYTYRRNHLDIAACAVRDCLSFAGHFARSYPVNANTGERSNACFERRNNASIKTQAFLDPDDAINFLSSAPPWLEEKRSRMRIHDTGYAHWVATIAAERLMEFESNPQAEGMASSVLAWEEALLSLGLAPHRDTIRTVLAGLVEKHGVRALKPHRQTIYNFDQVWGKIASNPVFAAMVRGS